MKDNDDDPCCQRKRRPVDDFFFAQGNQVAFGHENGSDCFTTKFYLLQETAEKQQADDAIAMDFPCPACPLVFQDMPTLDHHYEVNHVWHCHECGCVFRNNHLLDLHLQEAHDSYFQAVVASKRRNNNGQNCYYKCLVESCSVAFESERERLEHLQTQHGYPKWFRFLPKSSHTTCQSGFAIGQEQGTPMSKKKEKWIKKRRVKSSQEETNETNYSNTSMEESTITTNDTNKTEQQQRMKRLKRKQAKKEKRAKIPCRFYKTTEGCWRGNACMFLHDDADAEMDALSRDFQTKMPSKISFGQKQRR